MGRTYRLIVRVLVLTLATAFLVGCAAADPATTRAWIDVPTPGSTVFAGLEVEVLSHAYARAGVVEVLLAVNGVPYRRDPPAEPGAEFTSASQVWLPEAPGEYVLEVVAYAADGDASPPAFSRVEVLPAKTPTPTPTETPVEVPTLTPTAPPTIPATPFVVFGADRTTLMPGECTMLRWRIEDALSAALDGATVPLEGSKNVCPSATRTYLLQVVAFTGPMERAVTITVSAPADTAKPTISGVTPSTTTIRQPNCTPNTVTFTANVSDNVGVTQVEVIYRVSGGSWESRSMSGSGTYQATLDWNALKQSRDPVPTVPGTTLQFYIRARDAAGNTAESAAGSLTIAGCLM